MTQFLVYDVFTEDPFGGNQLAVIPDATKLEDDSLQKIAREFNFSESTFVFPPTNPANTARVRIFTPTQEIPFAGHPTIGTAVALADLGRGADLVLELGVGDIPAQVDGPSASFTTSVPLEILAEPDVAMTAACLGVDAGHVIGQPVIASVGLPFALVELDTLETLARARPVGDAHLAASRAYPSDLGFAVMAYVRKDNRIRARMFAPLDNIPEDPATGSAAAALAAYLGRGTAPPIRFEIHQGVEMGRPSLIKAGVDDTGAITIRGTAVRTMEGRLTI